MSKRYKYVILYATFLSSFFLIKEYLASAETVIYNPLNPAEPIQPEESVVALIPENSTATNQEASAVVEFPVTKVEKKVSVKQKAEFDNYILQSPVDAFQPDEKFRLRSIKYNKRYALNEHLFEDEKITIANSASQNGVTGGGANSKSFYLSDVCYLLSGVILFGKKERSGDRIYVHDILR
ncbi:MULTISPECIES: hypothetical protein [unclassified Enterococcus]|uniref:hypothetical protein n=1 Tax=unclassified Enterococcus TaxID=2608891 RepID=UPI001554313E|nr:MULTISPECIES: hypothetical protein [unclassified Enterococcus]MBS7577357.1 hypothetical protein [Enterococcus sp. MMGLQ5-2]MBS7584764.1 hypothetical protein [Enterococcus sp. MMGLQ5-1]NPD12619.1 hypothetical protein [Enterococcus sp. MMGLQ5-1]NPD37191.1 hypothetical protein [Enterococcus sp. MMGLQ5-2]